jgi:hypothetical protein
VCLRNLDNGIFWWKTKKLWGPDLGNSEYEDIYRVREHGLTTDWWKETVPRLARWRAFRGPTGINSAEKVRAAGSDVLHELDAAFAHVCSRAGEPALSEVRWEDIAPLYEIAFQIRWPRRRLASPVFPSKMCHFILPRVFPVVDNEATGFFDYEFYWRGMQDEWRRFTESEKAKDRIRKEIGPAIHPLYPLECRIIELSHIGYAHPEIADLREGNSQD